MPEAEKYSEDVSAKIETEPIPLNFEFEFEDKTVIITGALLKTNNTLEDLYDVVAENIELNKNNIAIYLFDIDSLTEEEKIIYQEQLPVLLPNKIPFQLKQRVSTAGHLRHLIPVRDISRVKEIAETGSIKLKVKSSDEEYVLVEASPEIDPEEDEGFVLLGGNYNPYQFIYDNKTNKNVRINSRRGLLILKKYIKQLTNK